MLNMLTALATTAIILGKDEQLQLVVEAQNDAQDNDQRARHALVQSNIRLAHKVAKNHIRKGIDFNDLLACAAEGILIAIDKFDATKKASFTTYARLWMVAKCQEHIQANAGIVHCGSRTSKRLWSSLQKARKALGQEATSSDIAEHLSLDVKDVEACMRYMQNRGISLTAPLGKDKGNGTVATLISDNKMRQDERMERTENSQLISKALDVFTGTLNDRQKDIFLGRIANELEGKEKKCANTFGVTKQRVGQIEKDLRGKFARHLSSTFGDTGVRDMLKASF